MANLVQGLMLLGAAAGLTRGAEFSHKLHLQLKPDCIDCHPSAQSSTRKQDNLLPTAESCKSCHAGVSIKQPRDVRVAVFNHAFHLKMGNVAPVLKAAVQSKAYLADAPVGMLAALDTRNACLACHRGIPESVATNAVSTAAKEHYPHMADCLVCHNKIDPPFSCETCHLQDKTLKPALHTPDYLDAHTRKSVKEGCAICHARKFTCLGCH